MFTMLPLRAPIIVLRTALVQRNVERRSVAITLSKSSSFMRSTRPSRVMPALFTRQSTPPSASIACLKASFTESELLTSHANVNVLTPNSLAIASACSGQPPREIRTTSEPRAASSLAMARPIPRDAPVTIDFVGIIN